MFCIIIKYKTLYPYCMKEESCIMQNPYLENISIQNFSLVWKYPLRNPTHPWLLEVRIKITKTDVKIVCSRIFVSVAVPKHINITILLHLIRKVWSMNRKAFVCCYVSIGILIALWWRKKSWHEKLTQILISSSEVWIKLFSIFNHYMCILPMTDSTRLHVNCEVGLFALNIYHVLTPFVSIKDWQCHLMSRVEWHATSERLNLQCSKKMRARLLCVYQYPSSSLEELR